MRAFQDRRVVAVSDGIQVSIADGSTIDTLTGGGHFLLIRDNLDAINVGKQKIIGVRLDELFAIVR